MRGEHENISDDNLKQLYFTIVDASNDFLPAHWHQHLEIIHLLNGQMTACINEQSYELVPGDILVINPRDIHSTQLHGRGRYNLLQIPPVHLKRISTDWELLHFSELLVYSDKEESLNDRLTKIFTELMRLNTGEEKGAHLLFLIQIYQLLYLLYTEGCSVVNSQSRNRTERDFRRIVHSMEYVRKNYMSQITLREVAKELSLTPEYFCRLFKKYTGQTFLAYVNQVRLQYFHQELLQTDESITYLLNKNGITNYKVFLRIFREAYGTTPYELRKNVHNSEKRK